VLYEERKQKPRQGAENMKTNKTWLALAVLLAVIAASAPLWAQEDRYVPDTRGKVSMKDLARYLGVDNDKKAVEQAVLSANREALGFGIFRAYERKDYAEVVNLLEQWFRASRLEEEEKAIAQRELDAWMKEAALIISQAEELRDGKDKASNLRRKVAYPSNWRGNTAAYKGELQALKDWVAETQKQLAAANARGVTAEDFDYDITRDGKGIVIKGYKGAASIVKIPAAIEGFPVTELDGGFSGKQYITSVTIPDSVTSFGAQGWSDPEERGGVTAGLFNGCRQLKSAVLPRGLKTIPQAMFYGCKNLETVALPAALESIEACAFMGSGLKTITLPASISSIKQFAFAESSLTAITFPAGLKSIGYKAFERCTYLEAVSLPDGIELGSNYFGTGSVFNGCSRLTSVIFQGSASFVGPNSFSGCAALSSLTINGNINFGRRSNRVDDFDSCDNLTTVTIGPKVTQIGNVDVLINAGKLSVSTKAALAKLRKDY
jgi:hypothetical protein